MIAGKHSVKVQILIQLSICFRYKSQQQALFGNKASNSTSTKDPGNSCFCITAVWSFPKGSQLHISQSLTCNTFGVFSGIFPRSWLRIIEPSKAPAMGALLSPTHSISASRLAAILHNSAETLAHTACKVTQWCKALHFCATERKNSTFSEVHPLKQLTLGTQNRQTQSLEGPVLMVALAGTVRPQGRGCHLPSPAALRAVAPPIQSLTFSITFLFLVCGFLEPPYSICFFYMLFSSNTLHLKLHPQHQTALTREYY